MSSWLVSYSEEHKLCGIADGNADITSYFNLISDKSKTTWEKDAIDLQ